MAQEQQTAAAIDSEVSHTASKSQPHRLERSTFLANI
jgi:hypothetical protein